MKKACISALLWLACLGALAPAQALQITLVPHGPATVYVDDYVQVDMSIVGLQSGGLNTELGAFHLDLYYDPTMLTLLSPTAANWGNSLGHTSPVAEALTFADNSTPGLLRLDEVSLLDRTALDVLQGDSFLLASLIFQVTAPAPPRPDNTFLFADDILLGDAAGNRIPAGLDQIPQLILFVDEPATLAIFGLGLSALAWRRRLTGKR